MDKEPIELKGEEVLKHLDASYMTLRNCHEEFRTFIKKLQEVQAPLNRTIIQVIQIESDVGTLVKMIEDIHHGIGHALYDQCWNGVEPGQEWKLIQRRKDSHGN